MANTEQDLISMEEIHRQTFELAMDNERLAQLRAQLDTAPSEVEIEAQARRDLALINQREMVRLQDELDRANLALSSLLRQGPQRLAAGSSHAYFKDLGEAEARVAWIDSELDRTRAKRAAGFNGAPWSAKVALYDDAESRMMSERGDQASREAVVLDYERVKAQRDARLARVAEMRELFNAQQLKKRREDEEKARMDGVRSTAGLSTDTRAVLDPANLVERELPPGVTASRALTPEEESVERRAADLAWGEQSARDAQIRPEVAEVGAEQPAQAPESNEKKSRAERFNAKPSSTSEIGSDAAPLIAIEQLYTPDEVQATRARQEADLAQGKEPISNAGGALKNANATLNPQTADAQPLEGYKPKVNESKVEYRDSQTERLAFVDEGDFIRMSEEGAQREEDMRAALTLATSKFGSVSISGTTEFRERATEMAAKMGMADRIANEELRSRGLELQARFEAERAQRAQERQVQERVLQNSFAAGPIAQEQASVEAAAHEHQAQPHHGVRDEEDLQIISLRNTNKGAQTIHGDEEDLRIVSMLPSNQRGQTTSDSVDESDEEDLRIVSMNPHSRGHSQLKANDNILGKALGSSGSMGARL